MGPNYGPGLEATSSLNLWFQFRTFFPSKISTKFAFLYFQRNKQNFPKRNSENRRRQKIRKSSFWFVLDRKNRANFFPRCFKGEAIFFLGENMKVSGKPKGARKLERVGLQSVWLGSPGTDNEVQGSKNSIMAYFSINDARIYWHYYLPHGALV